MSTLIGCYDNTANTVALNRQTQSFNKMIYNYYILLYSFQSHTVNEEVTGAAASVDPSDSATLSSLIESSESGSKFTGNH